MDRWKIICAALASLCMGSTFVSALGWYEVKGVVADGFGPVMPEIQQYTSWQDGR